LPESQSAVTAWVARATVASEARENFMVRCYAARFMSPMEYTGVCWRSRKREDGVWKMDESVVREVRCSSCLSLFLAAGALASSSFLLVLQ